MPKETIQHARLTLRHEAEPLIVSHDDGPDEVILGAILDRPYNPSEVMVEGDTLIEGSAVSVHWSRDAEYVQLGLEAPRKWWDEVIASYIGSPELGRFDVYTESLTRKEINDLIKTLRRARDAAYGVDE